MGKSLSYVRYTPFASNTHKKHWLVRQSTSQHLLYWISIGLGKKKKNNTCVQILQKQIRRNSEKSIQRSRLLAEHLLLLPVFALGCWVHFWGLRTHQKAWKGFVAMQRTNAQKPEEQL